MMLTTIRWLAFGLVASVADHACFPSVLIAVALSHYLIALWASRPRLLNLAANSHTALPLALVTVACSIVCVFNYPPSAVIFMFHHALNETYVFGHHYQREHRPTTILLASRFIFNLTTFAFVLRHHSAFSFIPLAVTGTLFLISGSMIYLSLWQSSAKLSPRIFLDYLIFETSNLAPVIYSLFFPVTLQLVISYHFAFWIFFPLLQSGKVSRLRIFFHSIQMAGITLGIYFVMVSYGRRLEQTQLDGLLNWSGYFHAGLSLAVSSFNPAFVVQIFKNKIRPPRDIREAVA